MLRDYMIINYRGLARGHYTLISICFRYFGSFERNSRKSRKKCRQTIPIKIFGIRYEYHKYQSSIANSSTIKEGQNINAHKFF